MELILFFLKEACERTGTQQDARACAQSSFLFSALAFDDQTFTITSLQRAPWQGSHLHLCANSCQCSSLLLHSGGGGGEV